jgi:hypothetical protein
MTSSPHLIVIVMTSSPHLIVIMMTLSPHLMMLIVIVDVIIILTGLASRGPADRQNMIMSYMRKPTCATAAASLPRVQGLARLD